MPSTCQHPDTKHHSDTSARLSHSVSVLSLFLSHPERPARALLSSHGGQRADIIKSIESRSLCVKTRPNFNPVLSEQSGAEDEEDSSQWWRRLVFRGGEKAWGEPEEVIQGLTRWNPATTSFSKRLDMAPAPPFTERSIFLSMKSSPSSAWISIAAIAIWFCLISSVFLLFFFYFIIIIFLGIWDVLDLVRFQ